MSFDEEYLDDHHECRREIERLKAEVNRRRGEMAAARAFLDEHGVEKVRDGITLTFTQRLQTILDTED